MVTTLFQHFNTTLRIVPCNITFSHTKRHCNGAKQRQRNYKNACCTCKFVFLLIRKKSVLHLQFFFLLIRSFSLPSPFSIIRFNFFLFISIINQSVAFSPVVKSIYYIPVSVLFYIFHKSVEGQLNEPLVLTLTL